MPEAKIHPPSAEFVKTAKINAAQYDEMYARSVNDPDGFWGEAAERLDWVKKPTIIKNTTYEHPNVSIKWFHDGDAERLGQLHRPALAKRGDQVAIIWEGDDPERLDKKITYKRAARATCAASSPMSYKKPRASSKGDRVVHLPADDPGSGLCDAGLRAHRRRSTRSSSAGSRRTAWPDRGFRLRLRCSRSPSDEGVRGAAERSRSRANTDKALADLPRRAGVDRRRSAPAATSPMAEGRDHLVPGGAADEARPNARRSK